MPYEGYLNGTSATEISGWVYLDTDPDAALPVEILADGQVIATIIAENFREDLLAAGKGNGRHGFSFSRSASESSEVLRARVVGQPWFVQPGGSAYSRMYAHMRHTCEFGIPEAANGFSEIPPPDLDTEIPLINQLLAAYHHAVSDEAKNRRLDDTWTFIQRSVFPDFIKLVEQKNVVALADYMRSFFAKSISHGTYQGAHATAGLAQPGAANIVASRVIDSLASLAEAIGLFRVENPEQGHYGENLFRDPNQIIHALASALKFDPVPPNVAGCKFGLRSNRGILGQTDVRAMYSAYRIRALTAAAKNGASICEIGGGIGTVAYYANLLGIRRYTIIDLPAILFMQGYWLSRALPNASIRLYGDKSLETSGIRLLPPSSFGRSTFDLVYNQDSFPEMHTEYSLRYLFKARSITPLLLSINQEGEKPHGATSKLSVVSDLIAQVGGYRKLYRFHDWTRPGYVEELYESQPTIMPFAVNRVGGRLRAYWQRRLRQQE